ncbi:glycosyltransferase family 25 protein [Alcaligenaceae bacterium CGII-47]|nr:glycosyltransferase family 25 protein [Alcaligenaceae bacterium CGII-47]
MSLPSIDIISLREAHDRRAFMHEQMQSLGLAYTFFDAVHGTQNPDHALFKKYNDARRLRLRGTGSSLRLSQLGCFASHYLMWERCVQGGEPIIVLEDDALLTPLFMSFYAHAGQFAQHYGLVWLQPSRKVQNQAGLVLEQIGPFTVKKFAKGFSGTTGYLITPRAAQALLDYAAEWVYPVDNTMDRFYEHGIEAIGVDPVCLAQDDDFESFINVADSGRQRSASDSWRRETANLWDNLRRMTHNVGVWVRVKRGAGLDNI